MNVLGLLYQLLVSIQMVFDAHDHRLKKVNKDKLLACLFESLHLKLNTGN
jgi:hypothetical protein